MTIDFLFYLSIIVGHFFYNFQEIHSQILSSPSILKDEISKLKKNSSMKSKQAER